MKKVREFATGWGNDYPMTWSNRVEEELVGTAKGHLLIPPFRPFDFLAAPNKELTFLANDQTRIGVEALRGAEPQFHRNCDFDQVYFQWAGTTAYETEFGAIEMQPAELVLLPAGTSHRATGSADSLRLSVKVRDPVEAVLTEKDHIGETAYRVLWNDGPDWPAPGNSGNRGNGKVVERIHTWDDKSDEVTTVERAYERLVGASTGGRPIHKIRTFDIFKEVTGRKGPGPVLMRNDDFLIECYNTDGEQFAFHRGNRNEEFQFQFFGTADNICEFGTEKMSPGDLFIVRRGIAHRVIGSANFRRLVIYSKQRWDLRIDPTRPLRRTRFDVGETVVAAAPWRNELMSVTGPQRRG